jgi:flagellar FliL protein
MSDDAKTAPVKKKGRLFLVMLVVLVLLLGGGGAGAYWWLNRGGHAATGDAHAAPAAHDDADAGAISLPTFTVNLSDEDASRYLRVTLTLIVPDQAQAEELSSAEHGSGSVKLMKARSAILELLSTKSADELTTAEGKAALKKAIAERASKAFGSVTVRDVLFSEFVVQF